VHCQAVLETGRHGCGCRCSSGRRAAAKTLGTGQRQPRSELCQVALGVARALAVAFAVGEEGHAQQLAPVLRVGGACVRFLVAPPGELRDVRALEEASTIEGVRGIRIYRKPGYIFHELRRASDRAGAVLATGETRDEAIAAAAAAAHRIRFATAAVGAVA
jgi:hypothetical protein